MKYITIFLLIGFFILTNSSFAQTNSSYRESLDDVVERTRRMLKTSNKRAVAEWVTKVVDDRLLNSNSEEVFTAGSPFNAITGPARYVSRSLGIANMRSDPRYNKYDQMAKLAWERQLGNCGENSYVTYYILKQAGAEGHVRILESGEDGAHSFTVWGLPPDAIIKDPSTWGDGLVVDPWVGKVLSGGEAMDNKWFKNGDPETPIRDATGDHDTDAESWNTIWREEMKRQGKTGRSSNRGNTDIEDCFIATAVYGTPSNGQINKLRYYRENTLRKTFLGRIFISCYETFGPLAAYYIRHDESRKRWARENLVEPALHIVNKEKRKS